MNDRPFTLRRALNLFWTFLITRAVIAVAGYYSNLRVEKWKYFQKRHEHWTDLFFQWDSSYYHRIASEGYSYAPGTTSDVHFFPLYPLLIRIQGWLTGEYLVAGFVVANLLLLLAVYYFDRLLVMDGGDERSTDLSILYLLIFPTSFYLSLYYPESLLLLLAFAALYHARKRQWFAAGACGFLLGLCKPYGLLIVVPLLIEYMNVNWGQWKIEWRKIRPNILWLGLAPAGLASYMLFLYLRFGDALAFSKATVFWNRKLAPFWVTLANVQVYNLFEQILYIGTVVTALALLVYAAFRRVRVSYLVYAGALFFLYISANILESIQRYVITLFPLYIGMGLLAARNRHIERLLTLTSVMLLTLFTVLFCAGYRMY